MTPFIKQSDLFKEHLLEVLNQPTEDDQLGSQLPAEAKTPAPSDQNCLNNDNDSSHQTDGLISPTEDDQLGLHLAKEAKTTIPSDQNCLESVNVTPQQIDDLNQQSEDDNIITATSNLDNINDNICQLINVLNQTNSKNLDTSLNQYQIVLNKLNTKNDDPIVIDFISGKDQKLANNVNHIITEFKDALQSKNNDLIERHYRQLKIILSFINLHLEIADSSFELDSLRTTIHHSFKDKEI